MLAMDELLRDEGRGVGLVPNISGMGNILPERNIPGPGSAVPGGEGKKGRLGAWLGALIGIWNLDYGKGGACEGTG